MSTISKIHIMSDGAKYHRAKESRQWGRRVVVIIIHWWWLFNRVWLLKKTQRNFSDSASKSGVYCRKRISTRERVICITIRDCPLARGLEEPGVGICCPLSVRVMAWHTLAFSSRVIDVCVVPLGIRNPKWSLGWSYSYFAGSLCIVLLCNHP